MAFPSIELFPSAYKATKLYSQLPTDGNGDFTFARSTIATRVNPDKLIETVAIDIPRLDYLDDVCPVLLLEPQSTNLILQSETFDNASWSKSNVTATANQSISPDGNKTADKIAETSATSAHQMFQFLSITTGIEHTQTIYVKRIDGNSPQFIQLAFGTGAFASGFVNYDIINGVVTASSAYTGSIDLVDNGWARLTATATSTATASSAGMQLVFINNNQAAGRTPTYTGNTDVGLFVWGAQLEQFSSGTSYIITTTTAVTRTADTSNSSGTSSEFNISEGVLYCEIAALDNIDTSDRRISISNGSANNVTIRYGIGTNLIQGLIFSSSVQQAQISFASPDISVLSKVALKWKVNDIALWVNGVEVGTDTVALAPAGLDRLHFDSGTGAQDFYGKCKELQVYKTALTDAELEALTTL